MLKHVQQGQMSDCQKCPVYGGVLISGYPSREFHCTQSYNNIWVHVCECIPHPGYSSLLSPQSVITSQNQFMGIHCPLSHRHWFEEQGNTLGGNGDEAVKETISMCG